MTSEPKSPQVIAYGIALGLHRESKGDDRYTTYAECLKAEADIRFAEEKEMNQDLQEALDLLKRVDDYGIRTQMGPQWCQRVDRLLRAYGDNEENLGEGTDDGAY